MKEAQHAKEIFEKNATRPNKETTQLNKHNMTKKTSNKYIENMFLVSFFFFLTLTTKHMFYSCCFFVSQNIFDYDDCRDT